MEYADLMRALAATKNPNLQDIGDIPRPENKDLVQALMGIGSGTLGAPMDMAYMLQSGLDRLGVPNPYPLGDYASVPGTTDYIGQKMGADVNSLPFLLASILAVGPGGKGAKAGKIAKKVSKLPMDEASRMARAKEMGFDTDVYHGTHAAIEEFDPSMGDIGTHLGSEEQATNRLLDVYHDRRAQGYRSRAEASYDEGANVMPLMAKKGKVLELPDVGRWNDSDQVIAALNDKPEFNGKFDSAWEYLGVRDQYEDTADWIASTENRELLDEINSTLQEHGYDTVKYKNAVENTYGGTSSLKPGIKAEKDKISAEIKAIQKRVIDRRPTLRGDETTPEIEKWLEWDEKAAYMPEETQRIDDLRAVLFDLGRSDSHYVDTYSYISLNPANIRSKFAKFDPSKAGSANLMAAHPAATVLSGSLAAALLSQMNQQDR